MALRGHVFNKQLFTSECFALFIDTFLDKNNGIVKGCGLSNTATTITIKDGFFCIKGRFLQEEGGSTFEIEPTTQNDIYCRIICEIDLSQENTTAELKQAQYKILESTREYPVLRQEDIVEQPDNSIYQFEFAQFKITENGIEDFQDKRTFLDFPSIYSEIRRNINAFLSQAKITTEEQIDALVLDLKTYCDEAKDILDGDVAINLLNLIIANTPRRKNITLLSTNWTLDETETKYKYKYTMQDEKITKHHRIFCTIYEDDEDKMIDGLMETFNGYYTVKTSRKPTEDVKLELVIVKTTDGNTQEETAKELEYEIKTKAYNENEKFHLEQDNKLETITNVTDNILDENNIIIIEET